MIIILHHRPCYFGFEEEDELGSPKTLSNDFCNASYWALFSAYLRAFASAKSLSGWDSISGIEIHRISAKNEVERHNGSNYLQYPVEDRSTSIPAPIRKLTAKSLTR